MERLFVGREYTVRFNFALTPAQDEWIRQQAFEQRASKADIVRGLLDRALGQQKIYMEAGCDLFSGFVSRIQHAGCAGPAGEGVV